MPTNPDGPQSATPTDKPKDQVVGRTFADVVWQIISNRYGTVALVSIILICFVLIGAGVLDVTWGENGLRLSASSEKGQQTEIRIDGYWPGTGEDDSTNSGSGQHYSYKLNLSFKQSGSKVSLTGNYNIVPPPDVPARQISGKGILHGAFLSLDYDIVTDASPGANTHGVMLLKFHPDGKIAEGRFAARSMKDDGIVSGKILLSR